MYRSHLSTHRASSTKQPAVHTCRCVSTRSTLRDRDGHFPPLSAAATRDRTCSRQLRAVQRDQRLRTSIKPPNLRNTPRKLEYILFNKHSTRPTRVSPETALRKIHRAIFREHSTRNRVRARINAPRRSARGGRLILAKLA